jgi:hypothetical protein
MKYVSPVYEAEAIATEDIMLSANKMANKLGITMSGDKEKITEGVEINLTNSNGDIIGQDPTAEGVDGVSISMNFGSLFG